MTPRDIRRHHRLLLSSSSKRTKQKHGRRVYVSSSSSSSSLKMISSLLLVLLVLFSSNNDRIFVYGESSSSSSINPNLPIGDINIVVLTDTHSWIGGHGKNEPHYNANYGDVVSFYEHLKQHCNENNHDVWFVMNGDWIDGTGLALNGDPSYIIPLLEKMPWDVVNTGNHELYRSAVVKYMTRPGGFTSWWGQRHLAANVLHSDTKETISNRYMVLKGKNSNVLVYGFLYNLENPSNEVIVDTVERTIEEHWFKESLKDETSYDAILIMAHMDYYDPLVTIILEKVRSIVGTMIPIQFITGHTHHRRYGILDPFSTSFEAGRYLDTVGFVSFPNKQTVHSTISASSPIEQQDVEENINLNTTNSSATETTTTTAAATTTRGNNHHNNITEDLFKHVFIDANVDILKETLGISKNDDITFQTENGKELSTFISTTQESLGLKDVIGCAPKNYYLNRTIYTDDSLWKFYIDKIGPTQIFQSNDEHNEAILISQSSWRYDLLGGKHLQRDDLIAVAPFNEQVYALRKVPCESIKQLNLTLNSNETMNELKFYPQLPLYVIVSNIRTGSSSSCTLYTHQFEKDIIIDALESISSWKPFNNRFNTTNVQMIPNVTSTSIWINYAKENWGCSGIWNWKHNGGGSHGQRGDDGNQRRHHKKTWGDDGNNSNESFFNANTELVIFIILVTTIVTIGLFCMCIKLSDDVNKSIQEEGEHLTFDITMPYDDDGDDEEENNEDHIGEDDKFHDNVNEAEQTLPIDDGELI